MHLFEDYIKGAAIDIEQTVPRVSVKYRDQLCFKGVKVDYDKFTHFVLRDGKYLPLFYIGDVKDSDVVFNMYPLICVGMAELLAVSSNANDDVLLSFCDDLTNEGIVPNAKSLLDFTKIIKDSSFKSNDFEFEILCALRSDFTNCSFNTIKRFVSMLSCCYFTNTKLFCEIVLEVMKYAYTVCSIFTTDLSRIKSVRCSEHDLERFSLSSVTTFSSVRPKRIGYTVPCGKSKHYISNCRGLGIYSFIILLFCVYEKFGEALSSLCADIKVSNDDTKNFIQKQFVKCLGDDFVGKYYKTGDNKVKLSDSATVFPLILQGRLPVNSGTVYKLEDGTKVTRDMYENEILWKKANHIIFTKIKDGLFIRNTDTYYTSISDIYSALYCCFVENEISYSNIERLVCLDDDYINSVIDDYINSVIEKKLSKANTASSVDKLQSKYKNEVDRLNDENKKSCESYEKKIEELNAIIASKSNIIDQLSSELKDNREYIRGYYFDEQTISDDTSSELNLCDIVNYLNQFKITMIGGRSELVAKLEEQGLKGVVQIDSENMVNGTPIQSDFFCINTKFISHKVIRSVESKYKDQKSQMFYFNGTNVEALLRSCYSFITEWVGN